MFKRLLISLAVLLLCGAPAMAQEAKTFAVLPFSVHGPQEYQYLSQGIQSMLTSRLTWPENFTPLEAGAIKKAAATLPADAGAAEKIRQTLGVDYLFWGALPQSMTIDEIKSQDMILQPLTSQKMARLIGNLIEMGLVRKGKSKSLGRMVYKAVAVMISQGYDVNEEEE